MTFILYYPPQAETITYLQCGIHIVQQWLKDMYSTKDNNNTIWE